jgi:hypothetical protein
MDLQTVWITGAFAPVQDNFSDRYDYSTCRLKGESLRQRRKKRSSPERAFCPGRRQALKNNKLFFHAFVWSKIRYNKPCQQIGRKKVYLQERKKEWSVFLHVAPTAPEPV